MLSLAQPQMAFLKMGIYGEAGSGKTYTASKVAIGLHHYIKAEKPVGFLDTETGSDFVLPLFEEAGIELLVDKTRSFQDTIDIIDQAEKECSILIVDSITHIWNEMLKAYRDENKLEFITLKHWVPLKETWNMGYSERYSNSNLHFIMSGRAGYIWQDVEDEDGYKELKKVGTKMKAEGEISYEPSLLVEMEHHRKSAKAGAGWINRAWVVKDRFDLINSQFFDSPTFDSFLPHIEQLNLGGEHKAIEPNRDSRSMFRKERTGAAYFRKHDELVENIKAEIHLAYPKQNTDDKTERLNLMKEVFGTRSFKEIEHMKNDMLEVGLETLIAYNAPAVINSEIEETKEPESLKQINEAIKKIEDGVEEIEEGKLKNRAGETEKQTDKPEAKEGKK